MYSQPLGNQHFWQHAKKICAGDANYPRRMELNNINPKAQNWNENPACFLSCGNCLHLNQKKQLKDFETVYLLGNGADKVDELYADSGNLKIIKGVTPKAKYLGELAYQKFLAEEFESLAYFEPSYGKEFYSPVSKKKPFLNFKK